MDRSLIIITYIIVLALTWAWLVVPEGKAVEGLFPYYPEQMISLQAYWDYLLTRLAFWILTLTIALSTPKNHWELFAASFLFFLYVLDFILIYNQPFYRLNGLPVSYSLFMGVGLFILASKGWNK